MPNRIYCESWTREACLNPPNLSRHAKAFFFFLVIHVDDYWRCHLGASPQYPDYLRNTVFPCDSSVRVSDVTRWLHELQQAGALLVRNSDRGWYCEVPENLRYRKEDYTERQPRFGPRETRRPEPEQSHLPFGPMPLKPPARPHARAVPTPDSKESDTESESKAKPQSNPAAHPPSPFRHPPSKDSMAVAGKDSASPPRFASTRQAFDDIVWEELFALFHQHDPTEMQRNGKMWEFRFRLNRAWVREAIHQFKQTPRPEIRGPAVAKWLTTTFETFARKSA